MKTFPERCEACRYSLAGFAADGGVLTCPECGARMTAVVPSRGPTWQSLLAPAALMVLPTVVLSVYVDLVIRLRGESLRPQLIDVVNVLIVPPLIGVAVVLVPILVVLWHLRGRTVVGNRPQLLLGMGAGALALNIIVAMLVAWPSLALSYGLIADV